MKKWKLILISGASLLVVLISGLLMATYFFSSGLQTTIPATPTNTMSENPGTFSGWTVLKNLLNITAAPLECQLRFDDSKYKEGTAFTADKNLRADILLAGTAGVVASIVINNGTPVAWTNPVVLEPVDSVEIENISVQYICREWRVDLSVFSPQ